MGKDKLTVAFHTNASYTLGFGHIMRCIALAKAMKQKMNLNIHFVTNSENRSLIEEGFSIKMVSPEMSHKEIRYIFIGIHPDVIIYDIAYVSQEYISETSAPGAFIVVFDYLNRTGRLTAADLVFNFHHSAGIEQFIAARFFEGMEYAILRDEFYQQTYCPPNNKDYHNILLAFGNSDPLSITERILMALLTYTHSRLKLHVVLGEHYKDRNNIYDLSNNCGDSMEIHEGVDNMAQLMSQMDMAFVSGGVTLFEVVHMRVPAIIVCANEYAFELASYLEKNNCAINLGYYDRVTEKMVHKAMDEMIISNGLSIMKKNLSVIKLNGVSMIPDIILKEMTERVNI